MQWLQSWTGKGSSHVHWAGNGHRSPAATFLAATPKQVVLKRAIAESLSAAEIPACLWSLEQDDTLLPAEGNIMLLLARMRHSANPRNNSSHGGKYMCQPKRSLGNQCEKGRTMQSCCWLCC